MKNLNIITLIKKAFDFFLGGRSLGQFIRYLITGFSTFGIEYLIFYSMFVMMGVSELIANSVSIAIVFWFNYLVNRFWSFKSKEKITKQVMQYGVLFFVNIGVSNLFMYYASTLLGVSPLISKAIIMVFIVAWNFVLYKTVIYKR